MSTLRIKANSHANRGKDFEGELDLVHYIYSRYNIAYITRLHVRTSYSQTAHKVVYLKREWCDYIGHTNEGRAILLEAKSIIDEKVRKWRPPAEHQFNAIQRGLECNCIALYLIRRGRDKAFLYIPRRESTYEDSVDLDKLPYITYDINSNLRIIWPWLEKFLELERGG